MGNRVLELGEEGGGGEWVFGGRGVYDIGEIVGVCFVEEEGVGVGKREMRL